MTATGITTTLKHNSKSYMSNNEQRVTRIEIESEKLIEEPIYNEVTLDTAYLNSIKESFNAMFKGSIPEDLEIALQLQKTA